VLFSVLWKYEGTVDHTGVKLCMFITYEYLMMSCMSIMWPSTTFTILSYNYLFYITALYEQHLTELSDFPDIKVPSSDYVTRTLKG